MKNHTSVSTFLLLEFSEVRELQILHFFVFLALYLTAVTGNLLIIIAVTMDYQLHTPMYFFLLNLAILDLGSVSAIVPKSMVVSLMNDRSISYFGCVAQLLFYFYFATLDFIILTIMAHDRYIAICNPLEYETIMNERTCLEMVATGWIFSVFYATLHTCATFANTFCTNSINQFFCEIPHLLKASCSNIYLVEVGFLALSCGVALGCLIFIIVTYVMIFLAVLRIPSVHGQKKALSTCIPHLTVVSLYVLTGIFAYVIPPHDSSSFLDMAFSVTYSIIAPTLNPFIYSMRNNEIKAALLKLLK
uniref:Olfactory receptor 14I1-like n=1 Tax=Pogona vitticeps TaxID=103695 RepID=A0A6J0UUS1_9SAUR